MIDKTVDEEYLQQKLEWVKYRLAVLEEMEAKLNEMKIIAIDAAGNERSDGEKETMNTKIRGLEKEVKALDEKSRTCWLDCQ